MPLASKQLAHSASTFKCDSQLYYFAESANSRIIVYGFLALTMALATSTPWAPSFNAILTSSPWLMPAPQRIAASELTLRTSLIVLVITSGCALETATPVPMSSGGSMLMMSGLRYAADALVAGLFVHKQDMMFCWVQSLMTASMSASFICFSE